MASERQLRSQLVSALDEVLPAAPWLEATVTDDLRKRRESGSLRRRLSVPRPVVQWGAVAALLIVAIVAGLMAPRLLNQRQTTVKPAAAPRLCLPGTTDSSDRFARIHGCITYSDGSQIVAVDPFHPANRIVLGPSNGRLPIAWSRDGRRLLVISMSDQLVIDLYVLNADGSEVQLTHGGALTGGSFSPDGTKVVYQGYDAKTDKSGLFVVDVKGGPPRLIASSTYSDLYLASPAWSPDGSRIAYAASLGTHDEIWTMNSDGTNQRQLLAFDRCDANQPTSCTDGLAWSPDGSQLAFRSAGGISIVLADGSGLHRISTGGGQPTWSADGSQITFTRGSQLFIMGRDGSNVTLIKDVAPVPNYGWAWNPAR